MSEPTLSVGQIWYHPTKKWYWLISFSAETSFRATACDRFGTPLPLSIFDRKDDGSPFDYLLSPEGQGRSTIKANVYATTYWVKIGHVDESPSQIIVGL